MKLYALSSFSPIQEILKNLQKLLECLVNGFNSHISFTQLNEILFHY